MVDKSNERVRKMFGQIAGRYDRMNHLLSLNVDKYWRWRTVRQVAPAGGMKILDVCTGTGDLAIAYHKASEGKAQIVGTDFCHEMLAIGEQKGRILGTNGQLTFLEADTQHLPFPDNEFDIVSVAFGLRNVANTDAGLAEMARVCKPGGQVAVLEFSTPRWQPFRAVYGWYFRNILPKLGQWLARNDAEAYDYLPESVGEFPQGAALAERMQAAGLTNVTYRGLTLGVATLYVGRKG
ncbi:bifunctional demethylmenaquinone methyltransferase/2-methoxy-6-polyprenyl-1,4-benzoquinol methylase UbiE [Adhaeretor mobilis]|uniref:Demethylmenaquinone methyltransferase n=1 Tax=Adhaeretor mobilis TaxID=1930276 RepID=A0A517N1K7_9BACT|nr:bifunctional demethylmenaquinone methyltransferase/2-methoxy-6-polyprenyl-1,4-benzoquinol methylase UbiE [Adhaeretor mobilis]QDT01017.1 UbiE/COQ5 methyltransferase [Adhaeretor mobilis]